MKKILLIAGIVIIVAGVLTFAYAMLNLYGYHHVLDGSPELYQRLHRKAIAFSIIGAVIALAGAGSVFMYVKK